MFCNYPKSVPFAIWQISWSLFCTLHKGSDGNFQTGNFFLQPQHPIVANGTESSDLGTHFVLKFCQFARASCGSRTPSYGTSPCSPSCTSPSLSSSNSWKHFRENCVGLSGKAGSASLLPQCWLSNWPLEVGKLQLEPPAGYGIWQPHEIDLGQVFDVCNLSSVPSSFSSLKIEMTHRHQRGCRPGCQSVRLL